MAATNGIITNHVGGTLSIFLQTSAAIGTFIPMSKSQLALATDLQEFVPKSNGVFRRINVGASLLLGSLALEVDGDMQGFIVNLTEHRNDLTMPGGANIDIPYQAGKKYRWKVIAALSV